jgi:hypothetical protein
MATEMCEEEKEEEQEEQKPAKQALHREKRKMPLVTEMTAKSTRRKPAQHAERLGDGETLRGAAEAGIASAGGTACDDVNGDHASARASEAALKQQAARRSPLVTPTGWQAAATGNRRVPSRLQEWPCPACTLDNPGPSSKCEACGAARPCSTQAAPGSLPTSSPQRGVLCSKVM